jgi:hypothetical protein
MGCLESKGYDPCADGSVRLSKASTAQYSVFNGIFVQNVRQGFATMTKNDDEGNLKWRYEGVFKNDEPNGQGQLMIPYLTAKGRQEQQEF